MTQSGTIVGYFSSRRQAESAIEALKDTGFTRENIGLAVRSGAPTSGSTERMGEQHESGAWEKIKGFFGGSESHREERWRDAEGEAGSAYNYEDVGQSLSGLDITEEQARYFRRRFGSGTEGAIVTVSPQGRESDARRILEQHGANLGDEASSYDYEQPVEMPAGEQNIQLYGEVLRVHTDRVSRGEARLRKEVRTSTQTVEVPVKREELVVERTPVEGERPAGSEATFQEREVRIPLSEERARVEKEPVVREEVRIGKKEVTDTETFDEKVRSEDLKVDDEAEKKHRAA